MSRHLSHKTRILLIASVLALTLAFGAIATILLLDESSSTATKPAARKSSGPAASSVKVRPSPQQTTSTAGRADASVNGAYPNLDLANTRYAGGPIRASTVSSLEVAWQLPIDARGTLGGYSASPVVAGGIVYSQDQNSNVQAIELKSGEVLWERRYRAPTEGPKGVVVANGFVYGATATDAFALDKETGREAWSTPLAKPGEEIGMAPGYHDGLVYVSTRPEDRVGGEVGVLWALDGKTGAKVWDFETVPGDLWGNPLVNYGGGLSRPPAFDSEGSMYFGVNHPGPVPGTEGYPWGSSRPGPNLYASSIVKLDAKTGDLLWFHQVTPHAICIWDVGAPVLVEAGGKDLVLVSGLAGIVIALDRKTGEVVWERAVGIHNGHDKDGVAAMRGDYSNLTTPMIVYPGRYGGVFGSFSVDESTAFVPVVNNGTSLVSQTQVANSQAFHGELVALDLETGEVRWQRSFPRTAVFGASTAVNDLVFIATTNGDMYAFAGDDGRELWKASLPAGFNAGIAVSGRNLVVPAGLSEKGQTPQIVTYRLAN